MKNCLLYPCFVIHLDLLNNLAPRDGNLNEPVFKVQMPGQFSWGGGGKGGKGGVEAFELIEAKPTQENYLN